MNKELSLHEISSIAEEAVSLGALSCLVTGGEPLLREDFSEIYISLKKKGLLMSIFTNATLINEDHVELFKKYPPREIEVSVYGVTQETYEKITRTPGSFKSFMRGLDMLLANGLKVRLKAVALRSNLHEMHLIAKFCRDKTKDYFRFDPLINLRFDRNERRNMEIRQERLSPEEIVALEKEDAKRLGSMKKSRATLITPRAAPAKSNCIILCGAGKKSCCIGYDGKFKICSSLLHPDCLYNLKGGSLKEAYTKFALQARSIRSTNKNFLKNCNICGLVNLCFWCPAHAYLEKGKMDEPVDYFCQVAHARAKMLESLK